MFELAQISILYNAGHTCEKLRSKRRAVPASLSGPASSHIIFHYLDSRRKNEANFLIKFSFGD